MTVKALAAAAARIFWAIAVGIMFIIYVANPLWPHSVAQFRWRVWASPAFLIVVVGVSRYAFRLPSGFVRGLIALGAIAAYFLFEGLIFAVAYTIFSGGKSNGPYAYLFSGFLNLLSQTLVIVSFVILCFFWWVVERTSTSDRY